LAAISLPARAILRRFVEEYLAGTEPDADDEEVRVLRKSLHSKGGIPLLDPVEFLSGEQT
jgi:hypothetical protein